MAIPNVIFANGGMEVPVSNGGGPLVVLPDIVLVETFGRPEPEEVEVISGFAAEEPGKEGVGVGALDVEGEEEGRGVGVFPVGGAGVGGACLFRRRSWCLAFSFSAFIKERAEKKTSA